MIMEMDKCSQGGDEFVIDTIIAEMAKGNFSFAILVVGILQLIVMIKANRKKDDKKER